MGFVVVIFPFTICKFFLTTSSTKPRVSCYTVARHREELSGGGGADADVASAVNAQTLRDGCACCACAECKITSRICACAVFFCTLNHCPVCSAGVRINIPTTKNQRASHIHGLVCIGLNS